MPVTLVRLALFLALFPAVVAAGIALQRNGALLRLGAWHDVHAVLMLLPLVGALLLAAGHLANRRASLPPRPSWPVVAALLLALLALGQSTLLSPWPDRAWLDVLPPLAGLATFALAGAALGRAGEPTGRALPPACIAASLVLLVSSARALSLWVGEEWAGVIALETDLRSLVGSTPPGLARPWSIRDAHPYGHANYGAFMACLLVPVAVATALSIRGPWRWVSLAGAALGTAWLASTGSRAGMLGLGASGVAAAAMLAAGGGRRTRILALLLVATATAMPLGQPRVREMTTGLLSGDIKLALDAGRVDLVLTGVGMAKARPWAGWGAGTTPMVYPATDGPASRIPVAHQLHSTPVQVVADHGIPGLLALLGLTVAGIALWRRGRRGAAETGRRLADGAALGCLAAGVVAMTDYPFDVPAFALAFGAVAGIAVAPGCSPAALLPAPGEPRPGQTDFSRSTRLLLVLTAAWLVLFAALVTARQGLLVAARRSATEALDTTRELDARLASWERAAALAPTEPAFPQGKAQLLTELLEVVPAEAKPAVARSAAEAWGAAIALNPADPFARSQRGWLTVEADPQAASSDFALALAGEPGKTGTGLGLASARRALGDVAGAADALAVEILHGPRSALWPDWRDPSRARFRAAVLARVGARAGEAEAVAPGAGNAARDRRSSVAVVRWWWTGAVEAADLEALARSRQPSARWLGSALAAAPGHEPAPPTPELHLAWRAWKGELPASAAALGILRVGRGPDPDPALAGRLAAHLARPAPRFTDWLRLEPTDPGLLISWTILRPTQPILARLVDWPKPRDVHASRQEIPALLLVAPMLPARVPAAIRFESGLVDSP